jgi:hypothetical protein
MKRGGIFIKIYIFLLPFSFQEKGFGGELGEGY